MPYCSVTLKDFSRWNADIFLMSPPCQPFTRVGLKGDKNDPRTSSFLYLLQTLPKLSEKPRYLLVENVKGFETSDTRNELVDTLKKCNYRFKEFLLSPKDMGIPNQRLRYFLVAKQDSLQFHGDILFDNGSTLLSHQILLEDNASHDDDNVKPAEGCTDHPRRGDKDKLTQGEGDTAGEKSQIVSNSHVGKDNKPDEVNSCQDKGNNLTGNTSNFHLNAQNPILVSISDLLSGSGSIKDYLEDLSEEEFQDYLVPDKVLARFGKVMDIVTDCNERTCCFTKAYGHYVEGTGSFLQTNPGLTKHWAFEHLEDTDQTLSRLQQLGLRYFTPREIANFHHFPQDFSFPSDVSRKQQYRLLGNSLNACVVAVLLRYLVESQDTDR